MNTLGVAIGLLVYKHEPSVAIPWYRLQACAVRPSQPITKHPSPQLLSRASFVMLNEV